MSFLMIRLKIEIDAVGVGYEIKNYPDLQRHSLFSSEAEKYDGWLLFFFFPPIILEFSSLHNK